MEKNSENNQIKYLILARDQEIQKVEYIKSVWQEYKLKYFGEPDSLGKIHGNLYVSFDEDEVRDI